jgi:glycosyltransferase involved in cell wall biosynthesis
MTTARTVAHDPQGFAATRVLALIKGLGPGGAEALLVTFAGLRDRREFEHDVAYLLPGKNHLVDALEREGARAFCLDVRREADLRWAFRLRRLLREGRYDVLHVHSPYAAGVGRLVVRSLPRRVRPAVVSTEHNLWGSFRVMSRVVNAATLPLGDAWLAVSTPVRDSMPGFIRGRVEVLVNGVRVERFRQPESQRLAVRDELSIGPAEVAVFTVANLRRQKAYPDLLRAAARALEQQPQLRFFAVGQGPLREELEQLHAELGLGDRFRFLGYRDDVARLLAGADLVAMASTFEGFPLAVMESLAAGVPVVATRVGGVPDAVTDGVEGCLVEAGDVDALAGAIVELASDPDRRAAMARAARERGAGFDVRAAVQRTEELYRSLLEKRRAS